ncbi:MAG: NAD(P)/FAD-dependent oxidoreductase [Acinetobacter sp.]
MVVGGGNTAVEEALYLSNIAAHVTLVHRRDSLQPLKRSYKIISLQKRKKARSVSFRNHQVDEVLGDKDGCNWRIKSTSRMPAHRMFRFRACLLLLVINPIPACLMVSLTCVMVIFRFKVVPGNATAASIEGVFAAGDVADSVYRQAITRHKAHSIAGHWMQKIPRQPELITPSISNQVDSPRIVNVLQFS